MQSTEDCNKSNDETNGCQLVGRMCTLRRTNEAVEADKRISINKCYRLEEKDYTDPITGEKKKKKELYLSVYCLDGYAGNSIKEKLQNLYKDVKDNHPDVDKFPGKAVFTVFKSSELKDRFNLTTKRLPEDHVPPEERVIPKEREFHSHGGLFPADEQQWLNFNKTATAMQELVDEKIKQGEKVVYSVAEFKPGKD